MSEPTYIDLLIENDELALDANGQPVRIYDRDVIAQDVRHRIRESLLLLSLVGERHKARRKLILNKIKIEVEKDSRIIPGSCEPVEKNIREIQIAAKTEFGPIGMLENVGI